MLNRKYSILLVLFSSGVLANAPIKKEGVICHNEDFSYYYPRYITECKWAFNL